MTDEPTLLSLFSGMGGLDLAVESLWPDVRHLAFCEGLSPDADRADVRASQAAADVYAAHRPGVPNLGDISAVDWHAFAAEHGRPDIIAGGFPCQDLSSAGKQAGIREGTRSGLWFRMLDAIATLRPSLVLLENVAAICTTRGAPDPDGDNEDDDAPPPVRDADGWPLGDGDDEPARALGVVLGSLAEIGFDAEWGVLRAADVGAPHGRARWFCVAWPADADDPGRGERWRSLAVQSQLPPPKHGGQDDGPEGRRLTDGPLLPTPAAWDGARGPDNARAGREGSGGDDLVTTVSKLLPTPRTGPNRTSRSALTADGPDTRADTGTSLTDPVRDDRPSLDWQDYQPAITRWARILRPPPPPVDSRGRLDPPFPEWMLGWPPGYAGITGASRSHQLKGIGNGVCPQQGVAAYRQLIDRIHHDT